MTREELIEARNTLGLSQKGMARAMGVDWGTYHKWEWLENSPSHRKISASTAAHGRLMCWVQAHTGYKFNGYDPLPEETTQAYKEQQ